MLISNEWILGFDLYHSLLIPNNRSDQSELSPHPNPLTVVINLGIVVWICEQREETPTK